MLSAQYTPLGELDGCLAQSQALSQVSTAAPAAAAGAPWDPQSRQSPLEMIHTHPWEPQEGIMTVPIRTCLTTR